MTSRMLTALVAVVIIAPGASAQVGPHGTFGSLPQTEFGGDGIPNNAVMISIFGEVTLGITATPRYSSPALTNNGAGTFYAGIGESEIGTGRSLWNFSYFIGGNGLNDFTYRLVYDMDPAAGNGGLGALEATYFAFVGYEGSQNLGFGYLGGDIPSLVQAPDYTSFDPFANGVYSFGLQQYNGQDELVSWVGMDVVVGTPTETVPEPATMTLLATGLAGLAAARRKKSRG